MKIPFVLKLKKEGLIDRLGLNLTTLINNNNSNQIYFK